MTLLLKKMLDINTRKITVMHLEPTDVCQASCALCARETDPNFDHAQRHHLDMNQILTVFDSNFIAQLDKMFMCGNYGDPAAGQHTLDIYKQFRQLNPDIVLGMNTNGAIQNTAWWVDLAAILNQPRDYVVFSIDGLEDTNSIYRQGVDWNKLMNNVTSYIRAGGKAHWDMLIYHHNQHQVEQCEQMALNLGFKWFRAKVSKRGFTKTLQAPVSWHIPSAGNGPIQCRALQEQSVYLDAQGRISACCWLGATQIDFETDFEKIQRSWASQPHPVCASTCAAINNKTVFDQQWQREVELC